MCGAVAEDLGACEECVIDHAAEFIVGWGCVGDVAGFCDQQQPRQKSDDTDVLLDADDSLGLDTPTAWFRIDAGTMKDPGWPAKWAHYKLLVCTPRLTHAQLTQIKRDIPGAKLIAYFDTQFAMIDRGCASSGDSAYYQAVNRFFRPEWAITDLSPGANRGLPVCLQSHLGWAKTRPAGFVVMQCVMFMYFRSFKMRKCRIYP